MRTSFVTAILTTAIRADDPIIQAPGLQRDDGRSFLGTMGPCGIEVLYDRYLAEGEEYHCQMADALYQFSQTQDEDLCTWGWGELAPLGTSTDPYDYWVDEETGASIDAGGESATINLDAFSISHHTDGQVNFVGSTGGDARLQHDCSGIKCEIGKQKLMYSTAMASFKVNEKFNQFMIDWRTLDDGCHHYHNITWGESQKFLGAWVQKVVPCSQLPENYMGKILD